MTGTEAVKHLKDFLNSPEYEEPTAEQLEAIQTAIYLLSKKKTASNIWRLEARRYIQDVEPKERSYHLSEG